MADIGMKLINGLEGTRKGGAAQRILGTITGGLTTVGDLVGFLTTKTANKPYVDKYYPGFLTNAEIRDDVSGAVIGTWNDIKLTENSPVWGNFKQLGLTDLQEMNTLTFNLAIASLRGKGIEDRGITNQKIALEMQSLGFGPENKTNEQAIAGLRTFLGLNLDLYDRYADNFFDVPDMPLTASKFIPGKGTVHPYTQSKRNLVNPWVERDYVKKITAPDGTVSYEDQGKLTRFDTNPIRERLNLKKPDLGGIGVKTDKGTTVVRVGDPIDVITQNLMKQPTLFKQNTLLTGAAGNTYGQAAIAFLQERNAAAAQALSDDKQPGTQEYRDTMDKNERTLYEQYALTYFGEPALVWDVQSPERIAFEEWYDYINSLPVSGGKL